MHQNFILKQEIDSTVPNYAEACHCAQMLKATDTFGNSLHWMFDHYKNCYLYISERPGLFPNRENAFVQDFGYHCLLENVHSDDINFLQLVQKNAANFYFSQPMADRQSFVLICKFRVLNRYGEYVPYLFRFRVLLMGTGGGIFVSYAYGVPALSGNLFRPVIIKEGNNFRYFLQGQLDSPKPFVQVEPTDKELEVLRLMAHNKSIREICSVLEISENTLKTHRKRLFKKLHAGNALMAVENAGLLGLLD
jgi:DNA-binding CsgD family transcriptional regulator